MKWPGQSMTQEKLVSKKHSKTKMESFKVAQLDKCDLIRLIRRDVFVHTGSPNQKRRTSLICGLKQCDVKRWNFYVLVFLNNHDKYHEILFSLDESFNCCHQKWNIKFHGYYDVAKTTNYSPGAIFWMDIRTFFTLICCKKLYCLLEKTENKRKRGWGWPIFKRPPILFHSTKWFG